VRFTTLTGPKREVPLRYDGPAQTGAVRYRKYTAVAHHAHAVAGVGDRLARGGAAGGAHLRQSLPVEQPGARHALWPRAQTIVMNAAAYR